MNEWRYPLLHLLCCTCVQPEEVTFREAELCRDVTDVNVQVTVAVDIAEIDSHSFK